MAVEASAVQIIINVVDGNSGQVIANVERALAGLGGAGASSGSKVAAAMNGIAGASARANVGIPALRYSMRAVSDEAEHMGGHFQTSFDRVRLLRTELGVRMPRAMESVIARSQALMGVINALGGALIAVGAIGIFVSLGQEIYNVWEKYFDITKAADEYNKELEKTRQEDFGNTRSIEDTTARIDQATDALQQYQKYQKDQTAQANKIQINPWTAILPPGVDQLAETLVHRHLAQQGNDHVVEQEKMLQSLRDKAAEQAHQTNQQIIESEHALDGELRGHEKINAELQKKIELNAENRRYGSQIETLKGNTASPESGKSEMEAKDEIARREAQAETFNLDREQAHELMQLRNEATNAQLRGTALYKAEEEQAIEELKFKDMDSMAAREAVHAKFHAEEMKRLQEEKDAVAKRAREADTAGLTGLAKIQAEGQERDQDILADVNAGKYESLADAQQDRLTNQKKTLAEMREAEQSFTQDVNSLTDQSVTHQISGFARIQADETKQLDDLKRKFDQTYGHLDLSQPGAAEAYQRGQGDLARGQSAIESGANQQEADLARKNAEETAQIEAEARAKFLSAEKQKTASIETEYEQRLQKYKDELAQQEISYDDFNRRVAAAAEERDAEMVEAATAARQKMASEFDSLFKSMDHPLKALQAIGEKAAANAAATMIQRMQTRGQGAQAPQKSGWSGVLDTFGLGSVGQTMGHGSNPTPPATTPMTVTPSTVVPAPRWEPGHAAPASSTQQIAGQLHAASQSHAMTIASAQIRIESAEISLAGSGAIGGRGETSSGTAANGFGGSSLPSAATHLGGAGIPSPAGSSVTGVATDVQQGIGFTRSAMRTFGGGANTPAAAAGSAPGVAAMPEAGLPSFASSTSSGSAVSFGGSTIGGAGSPSGAGAPASTGGGATAPTPGSTGANVVSDLQKGVGLAQSAKGIFASGSTNDSGVQPFSAINGPNDPLGLGGGSSSSTTASASNGGMLGGGGVASNIGGAATGALGLYSAYESSGGVGGALGGAMSGMQLGMAVGGPVGAAVGAAAGAVVGFLGPGGAEKARVYYLKQVLPRITADQQAYNQGGMDYLAAYSDLQSLDMQAKKATDAMGFAGQHYYQTNIKPKLQQAEAKFTEEQEAGRSMFTSTAAQYAVGTDYVPRTGMAVIHEGERVMPSDQNERITQALEGGTMAAESPTQGDVHIHMNAIDAKSGMQFLMANKHVVRSAVNASYAENSGGSDA